MSEKTQIPLTEEEKTLFVDLNNRKEQVKTEAANLYVLQKQIDGRKEVLDKTFTQVAELEIQIGKSLTQKYGDGVVDTDTGTFIPA